MDALVPVYVYHSLGVSHNVNFTKVFGRTAGPEVAISAGYSKRVAVKMRVARMAMVEIQLLVEMVMDGSPS